MAIYTERTLNALSLCSGYGGIELGLKLALGKRVRTVCYVEREAYAASVIVARMEDKAMDQAPIWDNVKTFRSVPWRGIVDIITAGYPCQPFSCVGSRKGEADPRHLWPDIARIIGEVKPEYVFCENVPGHLSLGFESVKADLEKLHYRVEAGIFSAVEIGARHLRKRLFFLGKLGDAGIKKQHRVSSEQWEKVFTSWESGDGKLENSTSERREQRRPECERQQRSTAFNVSSAKLADTSSTRLQRRKQPEALQDHRHRTKTHGSITECGSLWPSRPGEQQHGWEEPRTIMGDTSRRKDNIGKSGNVARAEQTRRCVNDANSITSAELANPHEQHGNTERYGTGSIRGERSEQAEVCRRDDRDSRKIKSGLDRAIDGTPERVDKFRVDRLRTIGNGVVPQVAALAFATLYTRFNRSEFGGNTDD